MKPKTLISICNESLKKISQDDSLITFIKICRKIEKSRNKQIDRFFNKLKEIVNRKQNETDSTKVW